MESQLTYPNRHELRNPVRRRRETHRPSSLHCVSTMKKCRRCAASCPTSSPISKLWPNSTLKECHPPDTPPTHTRVMRDDEDMPALERNQTLANAPFVDGEFVRVRAGHRMSTVSETQTSARDLRAKYLKRRNHRPRSRARSSATHRESRTAASNAFLTVLDEKDEIIAQAKTADEHRLENGTASAPSPVSHS